MYPIGRFFLEFLRLDSSQVAGINANQTLMLIVFVLSSAVLIWRHRGRPASSVDQSDLQPFAESVSGRQEAGLGGNDGQEPALGESESQ